MSAVQVVQPSRLTSRALWKSPHTQPRPRSGTKLSTSSCSPSANLTPSLKPMPRPEANPKSRTALVVEQDGNVVGFIVGRQLEDEWEIENIAVTGAARRHGLGSRLVSELLNLVRSQGGKTVFLEVRESNRAARSLYEKWGFLEVGRRKMYYQDPAEDALVLKFKFP